MYLQLKRIEQNDYQTIGHLFVYNDNNSVLAIFSTIELPWRENALNISCIPTGKYLCKNRWSVKYGSHFEIKNVVGRSMILIHKGNFFNQTQGCVLLGYYHDDINDDGNLDVVHSMAAMKALSALLEGKEVYIEVSDIRNLDVI